MNNNNEARHLIDGVSVFCAFDEVVDINKLKENPRNPNTHPSVQIDLLAQIIKKTGWRAPITVSNLSGFIVKGHGRLQAAKAAGFKHCPVEYQNFIDEEEEMAALLADNKLAELAEIDVDKLTEIFKDYEFEDLSLTGYSQEEFDELVEVFEEAELLGDPDEVPEEVETRCKLGDIWKLGEHRLMCGDSTSKSDIERLIGGAKVDIVYTDPPYGINIVNDNGKVGAGNLAKNKTYLAVKGDDTTETAKEFYKICIDLGIDKFILWGGNYFTDFLHFSPSWLIWDKRLDMKSNNFADGEMAWCSFKTPVRIYHQLWNGMIRAGERENRVHPTQKPIKMQCEILEDFTNENNIVLDCFGGSGSTLIACNQIKRTCFMMEYEPYYCDVIITRWETLTGKKAELITK